MADFKTTLPLTFLLALAAAAPSADAAVSEATPALLKPGSLRKLLDHNLNLNLDHSGGLGDQNAAPDSASPARAHPGSMQWIAQSCVYGYWRRC